MRFDTVRRIRVVISDPLLLVFDGLILQQGYDTTYDTFWEKRGQFGEKPKRVNRNGAGGCYLLNHL